MIEPVTAWAIKAPSVNVGNGTMADISHRPLFAALLGIGMIRAGIEIIYRCVRVEVLEVDEG